MDALVFSQNCRRIRLNTQHFWILEKVCQQTQFNFMWKFNFMARSLTSLMEVPYKWGFKAMVSASAVWLNAECRDVFDGSSYNWRSSRCPWSAKAHLKFVASVTTVLPGVFSSGHTLVYSEICDFCVHARKIQRCLGVAIILFISCSWTKFCVFFLQKWYGKLNFRRNKNDKWNVCT